HQADERRPAAHGRDVVCDVCRAPEAKFLSTETDDRHRRFGRDAIHLSNQKMIEHDIADDRDALTGYLLDDRLKPIHGTEPRVSSTAGVAVTNVGGGVFTARPAA